ncbi:MAG: type IV pilus modification protein PilV [Pseudomonadota bacterium]|nr:type IV pilus modification protein PilV [Pseudomonadota bacterium]
MNTLDIPMLAHRSRRAAPRRQCGPDSQAGSTLIEALVAMLVLSVGLLGIAGLASASLRYSHGAWARAAVASGLSDFADRVRANPAAATNAYAFAATSYADQRTAFAAGPLAIAKDCLTVACTPTELATFHITDWRNALNRSMPGAAVWVTGQRDQGYQASVMWFDKAFVKDDGVTPETPRACAVNAAGVITDTGIVARNCCLAAAGAVDGVRCTNMTIVP